MTHIDDLADDYLKCKLVGHMWDDFIPHRKPPQFGELQAWLCVRCQTERHDIVSWVDGSIISREYRYPEGYHLAEKYKRQDFRLAYIQRRKPKRRRRTS